nr:MAG TPA: hypothetical protein [Caudoviricetes sp.]
MSDVSDFQPIYIYTRICVFYVYIYTPIFLFFYLL